MIKRFHEVISIISDAGASNEELKQVQYEINNVIHHNLYNFMLPAKVAEVIETLTTLFVKMRDIKRLPPKVNEKRNRLLAQGRKIILNMQPYAKARYGKSEYDETFRLIFKRHVAIYLDKKASLTTNEAIELLLSAKQSLKDWQTINDSADTDIGNKAFTNMITELKSFITDNV